MLSTAVQLHQCTNESRKLSRKEDPARRVRSNREALYERIAKVDTERALTFSLAVNRTCTSDSPHLSKQ